MVEDASSCLGDPILETVRHISSNHMDMCRFSSTTDSEYRKVDSAFRQITSQIRDDQSTGFAKVDSLQFLTHQMTTKTTDRTSLSEPSPSPQTVRLDQMTSDKFTMKVDDEKKDRLIRSLHFEENQARLMDLASPETDTCKWFLTKPEFVEWKDHRHLKEHHGFLWIKGKPGAGKSILMKFLFSTIERELAQSSALIISFFFNARGSKLEKSTTGFYRSILFQFFQQDASLRGCLDALTIREASHTLEIGWTLELFKKLLLQVTKHLRNRTVILFVDALDECNVEQVQDMVWFFEELGDASLQSQCRFHICFSSRHYPTIAIRSGLQVILEAEKHHGEDISQCIKKRLRLGNSPQATLLRDEILEKSSGVFLWVVLVVAILNREYLHGRVDRLRKRLQEIPPALDDLFRMILSRDTENLGDLQAALVWILFAGRPLTSMELWFAVRLTQDLEASTEQSSGLVLQEDADRFASSATKGLAEVTVSGAVQFIHESVRDFLLDNEDGRGLWAPFEDDLIGSCHEALKRCCLAQLRSRLVIRVDSNFGLVCDEKYPSRPDDEYATEATKYARELAYLQLSYPFLAYAVLHLFHHSNIAQDHGFPQNQFFNSQVPLQKWISLNLLFYPSPTNAPGYPIDFTSIVD